MGLEREERGLKISGERASYDGRRIGGGLAPLECVPLLCFCVPRVCARRSGSTRACGSFHLAFQMASALDDPQKMPPKGLRLVIAAPPSSWRSTRRCAASVERKGWRALTRPVWLQVALESKKEKYARGGASAARTDKRGARGFSMAASVWPRRSGNKPHGHMAGKGQSRCQLPAPMNMTRGPARGTNHGTERSSRNLRNGSGAAGPPQLGCGAAVPTPPPPPPRRSDRLVPHRPREHSRITPLRRALDWQRARPSRDGRSRSAARPARAEARRSRALAGPASPHFVVYWVEWTPGAAPASANGGRVSARAAEPPATCPAVSRRTCSLRPSTAMAAGNGVGAREAEEEPLPLPNPPLGRPASGCRGPGAIPFAGPALQPGQERPAALTAAVRATARQNVTGSAPGPKAPSISQRCGQGPVPAPDPAQALVPGRRG